MPIAGEGLEEAGQGVVTGLVSTKGSASNAPSRA